MNINLSPSSLADYETFLKIRELPYFKFKGRTAVVPDEYLGLLGLAKPVTKAADYVPAKHLFDYQAAISAWWVRKRKAAIFMSPGWGKTCCMLEAARYVRGLQTKNQCTLMVSPLMVIDQTMEEAQRFYNGDLEIEQLHADNLQEWLLNGTSKIGIVNYEALKVGMRRGRLHTLLADECFPAGTQVDVVLENGKLGRRGIENLLRGDRILNASGVDRIACVFRKEVKYAVAVECGKKKIIVSPCHKFFTQRGWVGASQLKPGDGILQTEEAVRIVRDRFLTGEVSTLRAFLQSELLREMANVSTVHSSQGLQSEGEGEIGSILQTVLEERGAESGGNSETIDCCKSNGRSGDSGEGVRIFEGNRMEADGTGGKRAGNVRASEDFGRTFRTGMDSGVSDQVGGAEDGGASRLLQGGFSGFQKEDCNRGGWALPQGDNYQGKGCQENEDAGFSRVESLEILESGNSELEKVRDADGKLYFYDITATTHPSFSVNGLLVHNCGSIRGHYGTWGQAMINLGKGLDWKLLMTGTPAPNDRIEYANYAVFLDQFPTINSFLAKFFINRGETANRWEIKPHGLEAFYRTLAHWAIFVSNPATYGWKDNCGTIPPIYTHIENVPLTPEQLAMVPRKGFFSFDVGGITSRGRLSQIAKGSYKGVRIPTNKPDYILKRVESWPEESTLIWCGYNDEQRLLEEVFPNAASMHGATPYGRRKEMIQDFQAGRVKQIISKSRVLGLGLNLTKATRQVFNWCVDSYEAYFQCVKRSNRVGSTRPLNVHLPVTDIEKPMMELVLEKAKRVQADTDFQEKVFYESNKDYLLL